MARLNYHYEEAIAGMQKQGEGIKLHVDAEYAPLKAAVVGNTASAVVANPDTWEMENLFKHSSDTLKKLVSEHAGKNLKDADPAMYDKVVAESSGLADTLRQNGVKVVRYNQDSLPDNLRDYNYSWSKQKQMSMLGHGGGDVVGNCLVLDRKKVVIRKGVPKIVKEMEKRNFDVIEIDYETIWTLTGSGIHCSVMQLWREF